MKIVAYTIFALCCFALNSLLCRLALGAGEIDAANFTTIRIVSGAITLLILSFFLSPRKDAETGERIFKLSGGNWISAFFLFAYAICFSFAYTTLTTATGALILFGTVQATMLIAGIVAGEKPNGWQIVGWLCAFGGLVYLLLPGITAPSPFGSALMILAGIAWGFYTLRGRGAANPLQMTTRNFLCATLPAILLIPFAATHFSGQGIWLAVLSGALASGVGYTIWYAALKHLTATLAAILQLAVPIIAAIGGILLLSEKISPRLLVAGLLILGGILLSIIKRRV